MLWQHGQVEAIVDENRIAALRVRLEHLVGRHRGGRVSARAASLLDLLKASRGEGGIEVFQIDLSAMEAAVKDLEDLAGLEQAFRLLDHLIEKRNSHVAVSEDDGSLVDELDSDIDRALARTDALITSLDEFRQKLVPGWTANRR